MAASMSSKGEDEVGGRCFPPPPSNRLPSPPPPPMRFPPPPTDRLPSPPGSDGSGSAWERPKATISGVTNDARRVLDSYLNRTFGGASGPVYSPDCDSDADDIFSQKHRLRYDHEQHQQQQQEQEESHYVYPQALHTPKHLQCPFNTPQHPPKEKLIPFPQLDSARSTPDVKKKQFDIPLVVDSPSSSSTEDYELVDPNELINRKKKSFFRRATERLVHSFRRRKEHNSLIHGQARGGDLDSPKDEFGRRLPPPTTTSGARAHRSLNKTGSSSGDNNGGNAEVVHSEGEAMAMSSHKIRKSPLPWKHKVKMKEEPVYSENKGRLLDNLIRGIRKGSFRLKKKGAKEHQRSRSADNLMCIRPLSKEHEKVLRRYAGPVASDGAESDTISSIPEVSRCRVDQVFLPPLPSPLPPVPFPSASTRSNRTSPTRRGGGGKDSDDYDEIDEMVAGTGVERVPSDGKDEIDGMLQQLFNRQAAAASSQPFHLQSEAQKEQLYEKIAEQLAVIADYYNVQMGAFPKLAPPQEEEDEREDEVKDPAEKSPTSPTPQEVVAGESSASEREGAIKSKQRLMHRKKRRWRKELALQQQIMAAHANMAAQGVRDMRDKLDPDGGCGGGGDPAAIVEELVRNASYSNFQQLVSQNIGGEEPPNWQQIARMFRLTQTAVGLAGMGTAVSLHIKEMTIKYFEDKFAGWIVHQGGWESVVEDTNTENDSELD